MNPVISTDSKRVALHLSDRALSPIFSSADLDYYSIYVALTAYDASLRFGAGIPLSIMIETKSSGPILLSSYLNPYDIYKHEDHKKGQPFKNSKTKAQSIGSSSRTKDTDKEIINRPIEKFDVEIDNTSLPLPPLLIASAVAQSSMDAAEANNGIKKLVMAGRECQKAWIKEHDEGNASVGMI
ncbi:hypothetical protein EPUL_002261 [Erysiphe pulchra]|uniref:Uncharacterized protein n=1 Tax=Erysiphe pulchra TaxID=225359 RepID=A0A2S4PTQ1_9PEZI|nr:hypothetical protein EPUL_002261 [Erysiphe pulchra]